MTQARIAASAARANRAGQAEGLRQQGETAYSDRATGTELALGRERLGAEQGREGMRIATAQDIAGRRQRAAETSGAAAMDTERNIADRRLGAEQWGQEMGTGIATGIERDEAERQRFLATNRQDTARFRPQQRFQQNFATTGVLSDRSRDIAGARRQDAAEGRDWLRDTTNRAGAYEQGEYDRQGENYRATGGMSMGNTGQAMQYQTRPRLWERIAGAGIGAVSALTGGGGSYRPPRPVGGGGGDYAGSVYQGG